MDSDQYINVQGSSTDKGREHASRQAAGKNPDGDRQRSATYIRTKGKDHALTYVREAIGPNANDNATHGQATPFDTLSNISARGRPRASRAVAHVTYRVSTDLPNSLPVIEGEAALIAAFWDEFVARLPANDNGP